MTSKRRALLWTVLLAVAAAAVVPDWEPVSFDGIETVEAVKRPEAPVIRPVSLPAGTEAPSTAPRQGGDMDGVAAIDLFAAKTWVTPPPPAPPAPPPPPPSPPTAPPLPFTFMGRLDDGATLKVFLQRGERAYVVAVGDVIDGTYRVEGIRPGQITLIYLPLDIAQTLSAGSSS